MDIRRYNRIATKAIMAGAKDVKLIEPNKEIIYEEKAEMAIDTAIKDAVKRKMEEKMRKNNGR